ncbi:hypothetical protein ACQCT5_17050 [Sutcliffiella halmapala]
MDDKYKVKREIVDNRKRKKTYSQINKDAKQNKRKNSKKKNRIHKKNPPSQSFILYRILGNDLFPRHKTGQTLQNLKFILENEPKLVNCEKKWVVNRIFQDEIQLSITELLEKHKQKYIIIPFNKDEYMKIENDDEIISNQKNLSQTQEKRLLTAKYRHKINYVMNVNGARNVALKDGKKNAQWILPWDGNCFIKLSAWENIYKSVNNSYHNKYFVVPMARVTSNEELFKNIKPKAVDEPQIIFRKDSNEEFNEEFYYGRRDKVELLWRLGVPGNWNRWKDDPWDRNRLPLSKESRQFDKAGWVARLSSGRRVLEKDSKKREVARLEAVINTIEYLDKIVKK